jgi:hypothetical protein
MRNDGTHCAIDALWHDLRRCLPNDQHDSIIIIIRAVHHSAHIWSSPAALRKSGALIGPYASQFAIQGYFSSLACERPDLRIDLLSGKSTPNFTQQQYDDSESNRKNDDAITKTDKPVAPSKMKMHVRPLRCIDVVSYNEIEIDSRVAVTTTIVTTTITVSRSLDCSATLPGSLIYNSGFGCSDVFGNRWTQTGAIVERGIRFVRSSLVAEANQNVGER